MLVVLAWLEWLGEGFNPRGVGAVEFGGRDRGKRPRAAVLVCFAVACAFLAGAVYLIWEHFRPESLLGGLGMAAAGVAYLVAAYFVHPYPDLDNVGWFGGLINDPFAISDNMNRTLVVVFVLLWPGRFVSETLVDMTLLVRHAREREALF